MYHYGDESMDFLENTKAYSIDKPETVTIEEDEEELLDLERDEEKMNEIEM